MQSGVLISYILTILLIKMHISISIKTGAYLCSLNATCTNSEEHVEPGTVGCHATFLAMVPITTLSEAQGYLFEKSSHSTLLVRSIERVSQLGEQTLHAICVNRRSLANYFSNNRLHCYASNRTALLFPSQYALQSIYSCPGFVHCGKMKPFTLRSQRPQA
jgi:hypothetical protein